MWTLERVIAMKRLRLVLGGALLLAGCEVATAPEQDQEQPTFARVSGTAASVSGASFWAVRGELRVLELERADGSTALEFEVGPNSLLARPDGTPFAEGDSILITVTPRATGEYVYDFEPSGLTFSSTQPALIRMHFDPDLNGDGLIGLLDQLLKSTLSVWMQPAPGLLWLPIPSLLLPGNVVEGRVTHFTGFALAS